jgi:hypothetical protein
MKKMAAGLPTKKQMIGEETKDGNVVGLVAGPGSPGELRPETPKDAVDPSQVVIDVDEVDDVPQAFRLKSSVKSPAQIKAITERPRHKRIKELACLDEVHRRVVSGYPPGAVATYIQAEMSESKDVTHDTLKKALIAYREDLSPTELLMPTMPKIVAQAAQKLNEGLDMLAEIEKLFRLQMERIGPAMALEKKLGILNPRVGGELMNAVRLLESHHEVSRDLGLIGARNLGKLEIGVGQNMILAAGKKYGTKMEDVIANPESRRKLVHLMQRMGKLSSRMEPNGQKLRT